MLKVQSGGVTISYTKSGSGPPLVLVHGSLSDHELYWQAIRPTFEQRFTLYSVARRGRGESDRTTDHRLEDEFDDVCTVIDTIGDNVYMLGHSYGAHVALGAAAQSSNVSKLVLYEPPRPDFFESDVAERAREMGDRGNWPGMVEAFWRTLGIPEDAIAALKATPFWQSSVDDGANTFQDWRAMGGYSFDPGRFRSVKADVLLLKGSESPADRFVTDDVRRVLPSGKVEVFEGQGHAAMLTAPQAFAEVVKKFLLG
jgi:pimeloyl-ACP methyl ester carboxylesterase